ncbi:hypothetical protein [uncultured Thiodictyon sp.]|uniref:hypothetical protein n=1 Tax=uncultured Thiodictyon sp. TaxID=1846217 RepID=UPI0025F51B12|nr:hypothetical protein [uncultured Thiodictyon sp.]
MMIQDAGANGPELLQTGRTGGGSGAGPQPARAPEHCCSPVAAAGADERLFSIEASYNPHLLPGATRLEVVLTLSAALPDSRAADLDQVRLRLEPPRGCRITRVQQQSPEYVELIGLGGPAGGAIEVPLGTWGNESRDYFVVAELTPAEAGEEALAFWLQVLCVHRGAQTAIDGGRVIADWTADLALAAQVDPRVAYCNAQQELAESIRDGLGARCRGELMLATLLLGRAVQISAALGNAAVIRSLESVVEILNAPEGTVRLRPGGALLDLEMPRRNADQCI